MMDTECNLGREVREVTRGCRRRVGIGNGCSGGLQPAPAAYWACLLSAGFTRGRKNRQCPGRVLPSWPVTRYLSS